MHLQHFCSVYSLLNICLWTTPLASLVTQMVKDLPAMQETQVRSLGLENPLEEGMASRSSILAWEIPWTEKPGRLQSVGLQGVGYDWVTNTFFATMDSSSWSLMFSFPRIKAHCNSKLQAPFSSELSLSLQLRFNPETEQSALRLEYTVSPFITSQLTPLGACVCTWN